jgi:hypothetical protein
MTSCNIQKSFMGGAYGTCESLMSRRNVWKRFGFERSSPYGMQMLESDH